MVSANAWSALVSFLLVLIYVGFLLASRHGFERKLVKLFPGRDNRHEAMKVFVRVRDGVESYLWIQTVTGVMIAAASWAVMAVLGLDNAFFWAFLIFILSYIPIIGAGVESPSHLSSPSCSSASSGRRGCCWSCSTGSTSWSAMSSCPRCRATP